MKLLVLTPMATILDEEVDVVSLPGTKGCFTILNGHAPLVSSLLKGVVRYEVKEETKEIEIDDGMTIVEQNTVRVFVG